MAAGCFTAFISIFYLAGFGLLAWGLWSARRSTQAATWPTVPGSITSVELAERLDSESSTTYEVQVQYTYTVEGLAYQGSRLAFGYTASSGRQAHAEIYRRLQAAGTVLVRYDPADPAVSCLSYGVHRSIRITLVFAITWLLFVGGFTLLWWLFAQRDAVLLDNLLVP